MGYSKRAVFHIYICDKQMTELIDLRSNARQQYTKIDPNWKIRDDNLVDFYINEAYYKVQRDWNYDWKVCEQYANLETDGSAMYDLPTTFVRIEDLTINWIEPKRIKRSEIIRSDELTGVPYYYYIHRKQIGFYPVPDGTVNIDMIYREKLPKLTDEQWTELDEDFDWAISLYAAYLMLLSVEKTEKASTILNQYYNYINDLFWMDINDVDVSFSLTRS